MTRTHSMPSRVVAERGRPAHVSRLASLAALFTSAALLAACGGGGGSAGATTGGQASAAPSGPTYSIDNNSPPPDSAPTVVPGGTASPAPAPADPNASTPPPVAAAPSTPGTTPTAPVTPATPSMSPDAIVASTSVENKCVAPRTGTDPDTNQPFLDKQGTVSDEKQWVRGWIDETYLWYDEIPANFRASSFTSARSFFDVLKTPATTASGKPKDQFHFYYDTAEWQALTNAGQSAGYGFELAILRSTPPRDIRIAFTDPNTPASAANLARGATILAVDGSDAVSGPAAALNAGLFPAGANEKHVLTVQDSGSTATRSVTLTSAIITSTPVQNVKTLDTGTGKVGYLLFNDHIATSEQQLVTAMSQLQQANIQGLVIDLRYNGGGLLAIASQLAYMIAPAANTKGTVFERLITNAKNPFGWRPGDADFPFLSTTQGFSTTKGQALPQLGLPTVYVLAGPGTCSASESIINGLRGVGVTVNVIGDTTCGKPYGFYPTDNCATTYFAVQFRGVNNAGFGDYADGIKPTCSVADDFSRQLGDPLEKRLAAALTLRQSLACPAVSVGDRPLLKSLAAAFDDTVSAQAVRKPQLRTERFVTKPGSRLAGFSR